MKLTVLKENLSKGLNAVGRIVNTRGSLEVLGYILLKTDKGRLSLSSTNLEVGITYLTGAKVDEEGAITVPARLFSEFINSLPSEKITLELKEDVLNCKSEGYESNIKGISADEFPLIPQMKDNHLFSISSSDFKKAISLVGFSAAADDARPVLSGVYLNGNGSKITLAATDSYRLAEEIIEIKEKIKEKEVIIPARTLNELGRILGEFSEEEKLEVFVSENQILYETENLKFTSRLIEGQFPNYKQIIPEGSETTAKISKTEFDKAVRIASLFARENANSVNITVKSKGKVEISSGSSQIGDNISVIDAEVEGKEGEISFNAKYVTDVLGAIKEDEITLEISGKLNPGIIKPAGKKDYTYIIMPLRT